MQAISSSTDRVFVFVKVAAEKYVAPVEALAWLQDGIDARVVDRSGILPQWQQCDEQKEKDDGGQKAKNSFRYEEEQIGPSIPTGNVRQSGVCHEESTAGGDTRGCNNAQLEQIKIYTTWCNGIWSDAATS